MLLPAVAQSKPAFEWPDFDALAARFPGVGAVCLLERRETMMTDLGGDDYGKRETYTQVVAVLDPARAGDWLDRTLYTSSSNHVNRITARTWTAPGKSIEVKKDRIFDIASYPDYVLYQDIGGKRFAFPAVTARTVLEYQYEVTVTDDYAIEHVFANTIPTLESEVALTVPRSWFDEGFNQIVRAVGLNADPAREILAGPDGEVVRMVWRLQSIAAIPLETDMPPFADVSPRLSVVPQPGNGDHASWDWLGRRYWDLLLASRLSSGPEVKALAERLCAGATTPRERLRRIAEFTRGEIRYVAIELGIGGYQPHPAVEVLKNRYGDCKDKVCLLVSLLGAAGIRAEPALIRTASEGELDTALVDLSQFNHAIALVHLDDGPLWVDPTAASCGLDYLPGTDQATYALVVSPGHGRLVATPTFPAEASPLTCRLDGQLDERGRLAGTLTFEGVGEAALEYRGAFRSRDAAEEKRLVEGLLTDRMPRARLLEYRLGALDSLDAPFRLWLSFERDGAAMQIEQSLMLLPELTWPAHSGRAFETRERVHPIVVDCLRSYKDVIRITPPPGYRPAAPPEPGSFNGRYFTFDLSGAVEGDALIAERTVSNRALVVPARAYDSAREELTRLQAMEGETPIRFRRAP